MNKKNKLRKKFYEDIEFLHSPDARPARLLAEYFGPLRRFRQMNIKDTIVFFGSARIPSPEDVKAQKSHSDKINNNLMRLSSYYQDARQLAFRMTDWSKKLRDPKHRFIVTSGGGPGIMEAACRGAKEAGGFSIGLNISLPNETQGNPYVTPKLDLEFHYFFMRKFWFLYLAKALVIFPGGFGTLDELMELLTLTQTGKMKKKIPVVIYDQKYWKNVINFNYLAEMGAISKEDMNLVHFSDTVDDAFQFLSRKLTDAHLKGKNF